MRTPCPTKCGRTRRRGDLMCPSCWAQVPQPLQDDVWRTWRTWQKDFADPDAHNAYMATHDIAIAAVAPTPDEPAAAADPLADLFSDGAV